MSASVGALGAACHDSAKPLRVFFTGSSALLAQFQKYAAKLPFRATLKKVGKYFTLT